MTFFSRLGLKPVFFSEGNHGQPEVLTIEDQPAIDDDTDKPEPLVTEGAVFQHDMIMVFPEYVIELRTKSVEETRLLLKKIVDGKRVLVGKFDCDYFIGFNTFENRDTVNGTDVLLPGTHLLTLDPDDEFVSEFTKI